MSGADEQPGGRPPLRRRLAEQLGDRGLHAYRLLIWLGGVLGAAVGALAAALLQLVSGDGPFAQAVPVASLGGVLLGVVVAEAVGARERQQRAKRRGRS